MKYRNRKTGLIIDVPSAISGDNWEKVGGKAPVEEPAVSPVTEAEEVKPAKRRTKKN